MRFDFEITSNNITYNSGDTLIVDFTNAFFYIRKINSVQFDFTPLETADNGHDIYLRWTYDTAKIDQATGKPHVVWSAWEQITENGSQIPTINSIFDKVIRQNDPNPHKNWDSFDLQYKLVRRGTQSGARRITRVVMDFTEAEFPEVPQTSPVRNTGCKANVCPTTNFSSGILIQSDKNLFRPYDVMSPAIKIYKEMSCAVSEMFGHCVRYFKTQAKVESADPILKEYSLFEVTDVKDIKILIPDNQFPDNAIKFLPYDMDFGEGIECHIVREHFERAFGQDDLPEQKDYIYFPLIDRIFEVHSAYLYRDFMGQEAYYKVMLYKWQDKLNVMRENPEIDEYVNSLHESLDEVLAPEIQREYEEITKPMQYQTIAIGGFDHVRSHIHEKLIIETKDLTNYFTIVGKYYYDMPNRMTKNDIAVQYKLKVYRNSIENTAMSMWFMPGVSDTPDVLIDGFNTNERKGIAASLNYDTSTKKTKSISIFSNEQVLTFDKNFPMLDSTQWYGLVINHMNEYKQCSVHIWQMVYDSTRPSNGQQKTTQLKLVYTQVVDLNPEEINPTNQYWLLRAGNTRITNVRVWKNSMEEEVQPITLNQFVVRDQDQALLIDNCIPPMRLVKEYVR